MLHEITEKICADSGLTPTEIMQRIEDKKAELSDMISDEGAAYIVAKEMGIKITRKIEKLKIASLIPGMQNVDIIGKISRIFPVKEFHTEKGSGRVLTIIIADETGSAKISLWNDEIEKIAEISEGNIINIHGFVREGLNMNEIRLGRFGSITKSDEEIAETKEFIRKYERKKIKELGERNYSEVRAALLQVFESNIFFEMCPDCGTRLKRDDANFICETHGTIENPEYIMLLSGIIDDGTENMRIVFFRENAEKILGMTTREAKRLFDIKKNIPAVIEKIRLGKEFIFSGKVQRNLLFDRLEFIANDVKEVDIKNEIEMMTNA